MRVTRVSRRGQESLSTHFLHQLRRPPPPFEVVEAAPVKYGVDPVLEAPVLIIALQMTIDLDEKLLAGVFGIVTVSQEVHGQGHGRSAVPFDDTPEILDSPAEAARDQLLFIHPLPSPYITPEPQRGFNMGTPYEFPHFLGWGKKGGGNRRTP